MAPVTSLGMNPAPSAGNPAQPNGAQDYSAQWADYYRSLGKIKEAEDIEALMKVKVCYFRVDFILNFKICNLATSCCLWWSGTWCSATVDGPTATRWPIWSIRGISG